MPQAANVIILGGKEYPVQPLSVRQLRVVVPAVTGLLREMGPMVMAAQQFKQGGDIPPDQLEAMVSALQMTGAQFDLLITAIHGTIVRTHPTMTRDDFENLDVSMVELFGAIPTVMDMTGLMKSKKEGGAPGEAQPPKEETH